MAITKTNLSRYSNTLTTSGLNGKSITGHEVYFHGAVCVVEESYSGGSNIVKFKQNQVELGGTAEWGTGTLITV